MVDWGSEIIINGVFERHKSANSVSICAKIGQLCTPRARVYHAQLSMLARQAALVGYLLMAISAKAPYFSARALRWGWAQAENTREAPGPVASWLTAECAERTCAGVPWAVAQTRAKTKAIPVNSYRLRGTCSDSKFKIVLLSAAENKLNGITICFLPGQT